MNKIRVFMISLMFLSIALLSSCHSRNDVEGAGVPERQAATQVAQTAVAQELPTARELNRTMFVNAPAGLRVRNSPGLDADAIGVLGNLSEVDAIREENLSETIDGVEGRWTLVQADGIGGWVFGGFLSAEPVLRFSITFSQTPIGVYPTHIEAAGWTHHLVFSDGSRQRIFNGDGVTWIGNMSNVRVFNTTSKESEYEFIVGEGGLLFFHPIDQLEGWLFWGTHGFVYIYDFPTGGKDQHENNLLLRFPKFRRYGPLLQVNHNNNIIRFWDTGSDTGTNWMSLAAYYEGHEEMLLSHGGQGWQRFRIFNLRLGAYTDFISSGLPQFNRTRDAVISVENFIHEVGEAVISVYTIDNGVYNMAFREGINARNIGAHRWINDDEFSLELYHPEYGDSVFLTRRSGASFELLRQE
jgi:hypothetical protein